MQYKTRLADKYKALTICILVVMAMINSVPCYGKGPLKSINKNSKTAKSNSKTNKNAKPMKDTSKKVYLTDEEALSFIKEMTKNEESYELLNLVPSYNEIPEGYKAAYQMGDLDGSIAREVFIALKSGYIQITEKGLDYLCMLIMEEEICHDESDFEDWQKDSEIHEWCEFLTNEIKVRKSKHSLVFIGDCMFDRLSNNISALMKLQKQLHNVGVIHIKGNHDRMCIRYNRVSNAFNIPEDKRPSDSETVNHIESVYMHAYYDPDSCCLYTHNGISKVEKMLELLNSYTGDDENIKGLAKELSGHSSEDLVCSGFGFIDYHPDNPKNFVEVLNGIPYDNAIFLPYLKPGTGIDDNGNTLKSSLNEMTLRGMTSFRIPHKDQFPCFENVILVHGHSSNVSDNVLKILKAPNSDKSPEAFLKTGGVISINSRYNGRMAAVANVVIYKYKPGKK